MSEHGIRCPICGHPDDIDFMVLITLDDGRRVWMHDDCALEEGWGLYEVKQKRREN